MVDERLDPEELIISFTSGTTGTPLKIFRSRKDRTLNAFTLWECRRQWDPQVIKEKQITFHGRMADQRILYDKEGIKLSLMELSDKIWAEYFSVLSESNYYWMFGPPSVIYLFADFIRRTHRKSESLGIFYIELSGELLLESQRKRIEEVFHCPVVNHYGSREVRAIAFECPKKTMHILDSNVFVELIDAEEGKKEIVITSLLNYAQPFIRYRLNDFGTIRRVDCPCGKKGYVLKISRGRTTDYAVLEDGRIFNSYLFFKMILDLNRDGHPINKYQVIQESKKDFLFLVDSESYSKHVASLLMDKINLYMGNVHFRISGTDDFGSDRISRKFRPFISKI